MLWDNPCPIDLYSMIVPHILACHDDEFCSMIIILVTYLIYYIIKSIFLALFYYHYL
jgi:hypothetical protein